MQNKGNPYAQAASAYGVQAKETTDQRELESMLLLKAAQRMKTLQEGWGDDTKPANREELDECLRYNRQLWLVFYDTALENPEGDRPDDLRGNILSLCNFVFKHSIDVLAAPEKDKLDVLIEINREIAAGLAAGAKNAAKDDTDAPQSATNDGHAPTTTTTDETLSSVEPSESSSTDTKASAQPPAAPAQEPAGHVLTDTTA